MKSIAQPRRNLPIQTGKIVIRMALCLLICCLPATQAPGQRRPVLRPVEKDYFAGKFLLAPVDQRPSSLQQPQLIAEIADHDLITPPVRIINQPGVLAAWLEEFDYDRVDGVIISLDRLTDSGRIFDLIRSRRPGIPVYAFIAPEGSEEEQIGKLRHSLQLVDEGRIDQLLIAAGRSSIPLIRGIGDESRSAERDARIILDEDPQSATILLVVRMLNRRFGYSPGFLPVFSINPSGSQQTRNEASRVQNRVLSKVRALGGALAQTGQTALNPEIIIFLHLPEASDGDRTAFLQSISVALEKNLRVVLVDLSLTRESREALLQQLRGRKLLDRLAAYAAHSDPAESPGDIVARALGQASSFLLSIRFLRDDLDRVRRIDRAQIRMLLSRYLTDFIFPFRVRDALLSHARNELKLQAIPANDDRLADYATERIRTGAEELFNEQFRRNIHAILLSTGVRAQFEIRLLQRVQTRVYPSRLASDRSVEVEITPSIYLVHLGNLSTPLLPDRAYWELNGDIDDRILRRWDEINWLRFKVDAESVEMRIKIDEKKRELQASDEGYIISNRPSRDRGRIEITARSPAGAFYALGRLEQLGLEGRLTSEFVITEFPQFMERAGLEDFEGRWSDRERVELMRHLGRNRMNAFYFKPGEVEPDPDRLERLMRKAEENFLRFIYVLPPSDADQKLSRMAALGVKNFALEAGVDSQVAARATERARNLGAGLTIVPRAQPAGLCPWRPASATDRLIVRPADNLQMSLPGLAGAADYAWQGNSSSAENSYARAMQLLYDDRSLNAVRQWTELTGACSAPTGWLDQLLPGQAISSPEDARRKIDQLRASIETIIGTRDRGLLRGELARRLAAAEKSLKTGN
ncbi:MAG: DUF4127 family protein [Acidobacteriota bacterium]|nr:MAG: DUF4127 family protein [Acidobacteriota bacterium]